MMKIIIKGAQEIIRVDLPQGVNESFAAVPGSPLRGMRERLTGTGSTRGIGTTSAGFVWSLFPDSYFLIFSFLFSGY